MSIERRDPAIIKLFGRTIPLPSSCGVNDKDLSSKEDNYKSLTSNSKSGIAMKKPVKILVCPRCTSSDTKFCYFNNYNVNQPRHFCRQCQRYWTAGGAIRNMPVGAGRRQRKDKNSASQNKHCHELKFNGTVLSFSAADTLTDTWSSFAYSSILGKHTRDEEEKCLWIPKNIKD